MSKIGKFLAAKKGKSSVKASVDVALQAAQNSPEAESQTDLLESLRTATKAAETDEWGAEDSEGEAPAGTAASVIGGTHFHLISEEDVSKKQQRKPKRWGELQVPTTSPVPAVDTSPGPEGGTVVTEATAPMEDSVVGAAVSAALAAATVGGPIEAKRGEAADLKPVVLGRYRLTKKRVDVSNRDLFPDLEPAGTGPSEASSSVLVPKKKPPQLLRSKPEEAEEVSRIERKQSKGNNSEDAAAAASVDNGLRCSEGNLLPLTALIEEFLCDVSTHAQQFHQIALNDELAKAKFTGRKKRRPVELPRCELDLLS